MLFRDILTANTWISICTRLLLRGNFLLTNYTRNEIQIKAAFEF